MLCSCVQMVAGVLSWTVSSPLSTLNSSLKAIHVETVAVVSVVHAVFVNLAPRDILGLNRPFRQSCRSHSSVSIWEVMAAPYSD